jgi:hypothetical protein
MVRPWYKGGGRYGVWRYIYGRNMVIPPHARRRQYGAGCGSPRITTGLGDVLESTLTKFGITQERYKSWFGLEECGCTERKKWLNGLFSWHTKK